MSLLVKGWIRELEASTRHLQCAHCYNSALLLIMLLCSVRHCCNNSAVCDTVTRTHCCYCSLSRHTPHHTAPLRSHPSAMTMSRRTWACLALLVLLATGIGGVPMPAAAAHHRPAPQKGGVGRVVAAAAFNPAAGVARCKKQSHQPGAAASCAGLPADDDRVVPTGANPLHNR
jgi:hypothetical protein